MIKAVRRHFAEAAQVSGKPLITDPLFKPMVLAQQRTIEWLSAQFRETRMFSSSEGSFFHFSRRLGRQAEFT